MPFKVCPSTDCFSGFNVIFTPKEDILFLARLTMRVFTVSYFSTSIEVLIKRFVFFTFSANFASYFV